MRITLDTQKDSKEHILHALDMIKKLVSEDTTYSNTTNAGSSYQEDDILGTMFNSAQPAPKKVDTDYPVMNDDLLGSMFTAQATNATQKAPSPKPEVRIYEY